MFREKKQARWVLHGWVVNISDSYNHTALSAEIRVSLGGADWLVYGRMVVLTQMQIWGSSTTTNRQIWFVPKMTLAAEEEGKKL